MSYLEEFELISKHQFGFRTGIGTENALYRASKFIYESLDKSKKVYRYFLDVAKDFYSVDNFILINILATFGIKNSCLN